MAEVIVNQVEHRNVKFICKTGEIATSIAELAIVSSTPHFSMDAGAARAISDVGGTLFHERRDEAIRNKPSRKSYITIDTEEIEELFFKYVIVIPVRGRNRSSMRVVYREAIKAAIDSRVRSVVMPLLGTGGLHTSVDKASQEMLEALTTFSCFGQITTFCFIDINAQSMERLGNVLATIPDAAPTPNPVPSYGVLPVLISRPEIQFVGAAGMRPENIEEETDKLPYKEIARSEVGNKTSNTPCSICLGDLVTSAGNSEEDAASLAKDPVVRMKLCTHEYHRSCIEKWFTNKKRCPLCMKWYAASLGHQPPNGTMRVKRIPGEAPGHPDADGWFLIRYVILGGIQTEGHIRPGQPHSGTTRKCYIPNDEGGRTILSLLKKAFELRHIFTIGDSLTSGAVNTPVWVIHHKTSMTGGPASYGYPDPEYYGRVIQELADVGITRDMLD